MIALILLLLIDLALFQGFFTKLVFVLALIAFVFALVVGGVVLVIGAVQ